MSREVHEARGWIALKDLLKEYRPGSEVWSWDEEANDLLTRPCFCPAAGAPTDQPAAPSEPCGIAGHYQLQLEAYLSALGRVEQPICLGNDGRIWDGHHRVVAAIRLEFDRLPVEDNRGGQR